MRTGWVRTRAVACPVYGACLFVALMALLLTFASATARGRLVGVGFLVLACALWLSLHVARDRSASSRKRFLPGAVFAAGAVAVLGAAYAISPTGKPAAGSAFQPHYLNGGAFRRSALSNLVPEQDQFALGQLLLGMLDASMRGESGDDLRRLYRGLYEEMDRDPDFSAAGSSLQHAWKELTFGDYDVGHVFAYLPERDDGEALPVLLFLHGSIGNFKFYTWLLRDFADANGVAVVAPTFGIGNWQRPGGVAAIERVRRWCSEHPALDGSRVVLACVSNGGRGLTRAAKADPNAWAGLVSISGVLETQIVDARFAQALQGTPMLVLQGAGDRRVPEASVRERVDALRLAGADVRYEVRPSGDHFLMMREADWTIQRLEAWMRDEKILTKSRR